jgi:2-polyprenyl-3-methyl-5-hydroxy-6-metoxy-1,4-benzoquinol methylase
VIPSVDQSERYGQRVFSPEDDTEGERLAALAATFDPASRGHLTAFGVGPGWHCLDVGSGAGTMARWLADRVGPTGSVTAVDRDARHLRAHHDPRLTVHETDLTAFDPGAGRFDLVHSRMVLMHVREHEAMLRRMVGWLKPGGLMVMSDSAELGGASSTHPAYRATLTGLSRLLDVTIGTDTNHGRRYPGLLAECGLTGVTLAVDLPVVTADSPMARFWELTIRQTAPRLIELGLVEPGAVDEALRYLRDPGTHELSLVLCTASGRRPA